jgi:dTDP-4-dehydrorhamnose reductase
MAQTNADSTPLQLWGGAECTIVRLGDSWRDQAEETGHAARRSDFEAMAELGLKRIRFPILWERVAPDRPDRLDFSWTDDRLALLRERGVGVIAGLLHHGSGPRYTELLDPDFPAKLGDYAARVAERYPWIDMWTPVNEPLTTARFSGLYGHWYPHRRDEGAYLEALVNECLGTVEAMAAIRAVNPDALLVQTEDLGKIFSTPPLRNQAEHENKRRWLSFDLLCGKVDERHAFWPRLIKAGIAEEKLVRLCSGAGTPDMLGINHYLTSERFLDHRLHHYPAHEAGGNGRDTYVDAEAVRVLHLDADTGIAARLREAWSRYAIPIAVTEVHHGCTRDEQLRWFTEVWKSAAQVQGEGVDIRAVTLWSLFGNVDWRSLLTRRDGVYDTGVYDARGGEPRPTVIASAARAYARGEDFDHPVLDLPGWWRRPQRLYPWNGKCKSLGSEGRKVLITGATGTLGQAFARICEHRGLPFCLTDREALDIEDDDSVASAIERFRPWAVINTAGFVRVAEAEQQREACLAANCEGAERLAKACAAAAIPLVTFSSDLVFDGRLGRPYVESDPIGPAGVYGRSKAEAEQKVLAATDHALIVRTSAFFGPWDRYNFAWAAMNALARGEPFEASSTSEVSPTYVPDLCHATLDLLIDGEKGIWHLANPGRISWYDFALRVAQGAGLDASLIKPVIGGEPLLNALTSERGVLLRPFDAALADYLDQMRGQFAEERDLAAAE